MNLDLAAETAKVLNFKALSEWGSTFSLERCTQEGFLAFLDINDVPRVVIERDLPPDAFIERLEQCPHGADIVIKDIRELSEECAAVLRDVLFGAPLCEPLKHRYFFVGVSDREGLGRNQAEVLAFCTPIDLPLFVQHETMQTGLMSLNVMVAVEEGIKDWKKGDLLTIKDTYTFEFESKQITYKHGCKLEFLSRWDVRRVDVWDEENKREIIMPATVLEAYPLVRSDNHAVMDEAVDRQKCPVCAEPVSGCCRCSGPHTMEQLGKGHGAHCINGHRWSYQDDGQALVLKESVSLEESPEFKTLKDNKVDLEDAERKEAMDAGCVWNFSHHAKPSCAIWKSVVRGKTYYGSNTHRCYQAHSTLKAAIKSFHDVVEPSS
jgi:hypothetical protein